MVTPARTGLLRNAWLRNRSPLFSLSFSPSSSASSSPEGARLPLRPLAGLSRARDLAQRVAESRRRSSAPEGGSTDCCSCERVYAVASEGTQTLLSQGGTVFTSSHAWTRAARKEMQRSRPSARGARKAASPLGVRRRAREDCQVSVPPRSPRSLSVLNTPAPNSSEASSPESSLSGSRHAFLFWSPSRAEQRCRCSVSSVVSKTPSLSTPSVCCASSESLRPSLHLALFGQRRTFAISHLNPSISKGKVHYRVPNPFIPVLLRQSVPGLGKRGELKQVRRGTLRHFLAPKGLAVVATWQNIDEFYLAEKEAAAGDARARENKGASSVHEARGGKGEGAAGRAGGCGVRDGAADEEEGEMTERERLGEDEAHVPIAAFLNKYTAKFFVDTEAADPTKIRGAGVSVYDILSKVSEEVELDLLPSQLTIGRRQQPATDAQVGGGELRGAGADERDEEEESMRQDGVISRCGVYTVRAAIPLKNRIARKTFWVEVLSKQEAERLLQERQRREEEEARRSEFALGEA
ncbi:ribosomal protein L9, N-terminal domain-containing protein [Besnoitia besnoiti]|uniref:Ribosomal protein L9, N-terminal domain-containing protein n=1 Tax=Besnoitia besnoiti TaxID=94643 RepID=A0A2A9MGN2_BESBE|nr:ribosomal protein L9, N-terminal domain-containing protein [Besnoitia besnoiti]PFH37069.1 ribosomal protein L9, N-terminal domain-containing protein [Besnoitia besnoiti]